MTWTKLDDSFYDNPKVVEAGNELAGVFARALSYCGRHLTDGRVPAEIARGLAGSNKTASRMVEAGLWRENGRGYVIPDYLDFNPSKEQLAERRRRDSERKAAGRP